MHFWIFDEVEHWSAQAFKAEFGFDWGWLLLIREAAGVYRRPVLYGR
jgi:hypothetical protein